MFKISESGFQPVESSVQSSIEYIQSSTTTEHTFDVETIQKEIYKMSTDELFSTATCLFTVYAGYINTDRMKQLADADTDKDEFFQKFKEFKKLATTDSFNELYEEYKQNSEVLLFGNDSQSSKRDLMNAILRAIYTTLTGTVV